MWQPSEWSETVAAARAGNSRAVQRLVEMLVAWARRELSTIAGQESEDVIYAFVGHMIRDEFSHLPELEAARLEAFLQASLTNFVIDWQRRERRREVHEIPFSQLLRPEREEGELNLNNLPGAAETPEEALLRHEREAALRAAVERHAAVDRLIFHLRFEEELSEAEIGRRLQMKPNTVAKRIERMRARLRRWLQENGE